MGLFDSLVNAMNETVKKNYKSATGRNYDRDFQEYLEDWERKCGWNGDYTLRELMKEKGFDLY